MNASSAHTATRHGTQALWAILAGIPGAVSVVLLISDSIRAFNPLPYWDMWDGYLGFWFRLQDGDSSIWWLPHNEHRIPIAKAFFWADINWFHGMQWFLIVSILLSALFIAAVFVWALFMNLAQAGVSRRPLWVPVLLSSIIIASATSWIQSENLAWGFQIQFMLGTLLPLLGFTLLSVSEARRERKIVGAIAFVLALVFAAASVFTIASGLLVPWAMALAAGLFYRRILKALLLLVVSIVTTIAYLHGYAPVGSSSPLATLKAHPLGVALHAVEYLAGPVTYVTGSEKLGLISAFALAAIAAWSAYVILWRRGATPVFVAMATFVMLTVVTSVVVSTGRLEIGAMQASRYQTPLLAASSAVIVMFAPWIMRSTGNLRRGVVVCCLVLLLLFGIDQVRPLTADGSAQATRDQATLALSIGVHDSTVIGTVYPSADSALAAAVRARQEGITILGQEPFLYLKERLGTPFASVPKITCQGFVDESSKPDDPAFLRLRGWVYPQDSLGTDSSVLSLVSREGLIVGYLVGDGERPDVATAIGNDALRSGFLGYVVSDALNEPVYVAGNNAMCATPLSMPEQIAK